MKKILFIILVVALLGFFLWRAPAREVAWGVSFSQKHAEALGLDWKEAYAAILDELRPKNLRLAAHWDKLEPQDGIFNFEDLDYQMREASTRGADIILAVGIKTPRWPECHVPEWARALSDEEKLERALKLTEEIIKRYEDNANISAWQVENEPFFPFGECPPISKDFVAREISLVKAIDLSRKIMVTDTGEWSLWIRVARLGDVVGVTLYRKAFIAPLGTFLSYPFPPAYYRVRAWFVENVLSREVIPVEVQAEPWFQSYPLGNSEDDWKKTLDLPQFRKNLEYTRAAGFEEAYLWGVEWWWYMKEKGGEPSFWEEAKTLF